MRTIALSFAAASALATTAPSAFAQEAKPPKVEDLAGYTADLKGKGPLTAKIETSKGTITCELFDKKAPLTVTNFVGLARGKKPFLDPKSGKVETRPFYDGLTFHRVIPEFMIQGGDPTGTGRGNPGYAFQTETHAELKHDKPGTLAMANAGPDTNGSQFYITEGPVPRLDEMETKYNVFGLCKEVAVVKKIARVPRDPSDKPNEPVIIKKITISRR